jgi:nickel-dependent lactate racemase
MIVAAMFAGTHDDSGPSAGPGPLLAVGSGDREIDDAELEQHLDRIADSIVSDGVKRVLLVPPDHTRLYSRGGQITVHLDRALRSRGIEVDVMPALGTHRPLTASQCRLLFGDAIGVERVLEHRWRDGVSTVGEIPADEVSAIAERDLELSLPLTVNSTLVSGRYNLVVAAGQVVPHEVAGFGGYTKHVCIGLGGRETIHRSHFISAMCGIEETLGQVDAPVRTLINDAFERFLESRCRTLFLLTVVDNRGGVDRLRGLFAGEGGMRASGGAAFSAAAALAAALNITTVSEPYDVCVAYMNPIEFHSTWLANKAIYRTRLAMADGGELVVVAPGVERFGEDDVIDALIRRHGYRGRDAALAAVADDAALAQNLAAAAHLVHGSTEGRFRVRYCPGAKLDRADIEAVGFEYVSPDEVAARFGADLDRAAGTLRDSRGGEFVVIPNAGLGLWRRGAVVAA